MAEEKVGEETYSLIFSSLKHPIRRRILRVLADKDKSFSEILSDMSVDSGHLSYHLENLGSLLKHSDGKYGLSGIGRAAFNLMNGVEEKPQLLRARKQEWKKIRFAANLLLVASLAAIIVLGAMAFSYSGQLEIVSRNRDDAGQDEVTYFHWSVVRATYLPYLFSHYRVGIFENKTVGEENVEAIVEAFFYELDHGVDHLRSLRLLYPELMGGDAPLRVVYEFMEFRVTSWEGTSIRVRLERLLSGRNYTLVLAAFDSLMQTTFSDLSTLSLELAESFHPLNMTRLQNLTVIVEQLETRIDTWQSAYS